MINKSLQAWDSLPEPNTSNDFLRFKTDGLYYIRVGHKAPFVHYMHWATNANGRPTPINCAMDACPLCLDGNVAKATYLIPVIDLEENRAKWISFGPQLKKEIAALAKNPDWGDPMGYNICINRNKSRGPAAMYMATPSPRNMTPLTAEQIGSLAALMERHPPAVLIKPSTPQEITERLKG